MLDVDYDWIGDGHLYMWVNFNDEWIGDKLFKKNLFFFCLFSYGAVYEGDEEEDAELIRSPLICLLFSDSNLFIYLHLN